MTKAKNILTYWLDQRAHEINQRGELEAEEANKAPCTVCGGTRHVHKYRKVEGQVHGETHGSFDPWFGGGVSGWVDGETDTKPVLACTGCGNERLIEEHDWVLDWELFWGDMFAFYSYIDDLPHPTAYDERKLKEFQEELPYISKPVETRQFMFDNDLWAKDYMRVMKYWSPEQWAKAGFKFKMIPEQRKEYKLFGRWTIHTTIIPERYPTWAELMPAQAQQEEDETDDDW